MLATRQLFHIRDAEVAASETGADQQVTPLKKGKKADEPKSESKGDIVNSEAMVDSKSMAKAPSWGVERSRNRIMCRTGLGGPGSTEKFVYGKNCKYASERLARAAAIQWVQAMKKKRALERPCIWGAMQTCEGAHVGRI